MKDEYDSSKGKRGAIDKEAAARKREELEMMQNLFEELIMDLTASGFLKIIDLTFDKKENGEYLHETTLDRFTWFVLGFRKALWVQDQMKGG